MTMRRTTTGASGSWKILLALLFVTGQAFADCTPDQTLDEDDEDFDGIVGITDANTTVTCVGAETRLITTDPDPNNPVLGPTNVSVNILSGATVSGSDFTPIFLNGFLNSVNNAGTVTASGIDVFGAAIEGGNAVVINTGTMTLNGTDIAAIGINGASGGVTNSGTLTVTGTDVTGIEINGNGATMNNSSTITINGGVGTGMGVTGDNAVMTNSGTVDMNGAISVAIGAFGDGADMTNSNVIDTDGDTALGMGAIGQTLTITNEAGATITTRQDGSHGMFMGLQNIPPLDVLIPPAARIPSQGTLINNGAITTMGDGAQGIHGLTSGGTMTNGLTGVITTGGSQSHGMETQGTGGTLTNLGMITTDGSGTMSGIGSSAMRGTGQNITLINGASDGSAPNAKLDATGLQARGMSLDAFDSTIENYGTINAAGGSAGSPDEASHGIVVQGGLGSEPLVIFGNTVLFGSNNTVINKGTINATGPFARSVFVDTAAVTIENMAGGVLANGVGFSSNGSGLINNSGTISGGITDNLSANSVVAINNTASGAISGSIKTIELLGSADVLIVNEGTISLDSTSAPGTAIKIGQGDPLNADIVNRGMITAMGGTAMFLVTDNTKVQNFGTIKSGTGIQAISSEQISIVNEGTITTDGQSGTAINVSAMEDINISNKGSIKTSGDDAIGINGSLSDSDKLIANSSLGSIITSGARAFGIAVGQGSGRGPGGPVDLPFTVNNNGTITTNGQGAHGVFGDGAGTVTNRGTITVSGDAASAVFFVACAPCGTSITLVNEGTLSAASIAVQGSVSKDIVTNSGTISGNVSLGDGDDLLTVKSGSTINGSVFAGGGDDELIADFSGNATLNGDQFFNFDFLRKVGAGRLDFSGTLNIGLVNINQGSFMLQSGSNLIANVIVDLGTSIGGAAATVTGNISGLGNIAPGLSPGQLDVIGNVDLGGTLEIEIAGLGAGEFDLLNVTGDVIFQDGAGIDFLFTNGFAPQQGDIFDFLIATSVLGDLDLLNVNIFGLQNGFDFDLGLGGTGLTFTALNDGVSTVPLPPALYLFMAGLASMAGVARKRRHYKKVPG